MQLINLLTLGFLAAASVSAIPSPDGRRGKFGPGTPACLLSGQVFNGAGKLCRCPPGQLKKPFRGKCGFPVFVFPQCPFGEKAYCARSRTEYSGYDDQSEYCDDDGQNSVFCCRESDLDSYLYSHYDY